MDFQTQLALLLELTRLREKPKTDVESKRNKARQNRKKRNKGNQGRRK